MELTIQDLNLPDALVSEKAVAVGVSGGPDSLALAWLMRGWALEHGLQLHVLSVDHGLRAEAADEVAYVADLVQGWGACVHHALSYDGAKPESAVQEEARALRYDLMAAKCAELGVRYLCLAHHRDDQGETFLFRLAKGSGLDGLCAMRAVQDYSEELILVRPLLHIGKDKLEALCEEQGIKPVRDPSNEDAAYARVRLRAAREALEAEGLSNKRLAMSALRLQRAQEALESFTDRAEGRYVSRDDDRVKMQLDVLAAEPYEIVFRLVLRAVQSMRPGARYNPRMEKLEVLVADLYGADRFRKRTLGGLVFAVDQKGGFLSIFPE